MSKTISIEITEEAKAKINGRGDSLTIAMIQFHGCTGTYFAPDVSLTKPFEPENFDLLKVDGFDVYLYKDAEIAPEGIKISTSKNWMVQNQVDALKVSGLIYEQLMM
jgi:hypothetical protein